MPNVLAVTFPTPSVRIRLCGGHLRSVRVTKTRETRRHAGRGSTMSSASRWRSCRRESAPRIGIEPTLDKTRGRCGRNGARAHHGVGGRAGRAHATGCGVVQALSPSPSTRSGQQTASQRTTRALGQRWRSPYPVWCSARSRNLSRPVASSLAHGLRGPTGMCALPVGQRDPGGVPASLPGTACAVFQRRGSPRT